MVICTDNLSQDTLSTLTLHNILYKIYPDINSNNGHRMKCTINKIHMYDLNDYDKVIFLDADVIVTKNIDNLFEMDFPIACQYSAEIAYK